MEKIIPKMPVHEILSFLDFRDAYIELVEDGFYFEVYGNDRYKLEDFLNLGLKQKYTLVSNKAKSVVVYFRGKTSKHISEYNGQFDFWTIKIYQRNSRSSIFISAFKLKQMGKYYHIFKVFDLAYRLESEKKALENALEEKTKKIYLDFLSLEEEDLEIFLDRDNLTSFEKKQVLFSYQEDILDCYDFYPERIDNQKQYQSAIEYNLELEPLKALYEKVAKKHNIFLKKEWVWKY